MLKNENWKICKNFVGSIKVSFNYCWTATNNLTNKDILTLKY